MTPDTQPTATAPDPRRWKILGALSLAQFMLLLDDTIVNVALPSIQRDLHFTIANLAWVVNAYVLAFGGFLLLGGRLADLMGRRSVFLAGLSVFAIGSLGNALAASSGMLIASRAVQGLGAALTAPAALAITAAIFADPAERTKAYAVWQGLGGAGAAAGVVLGGVLTDVLSWRWIFLVNLPVAVYVLLYISRSLRLPERRRAAGFDIAGAASITGSLLVLVYTLLGVDEHGWLGTRTIVGFVLSALLLCGFVLIEMRSRTPLVRLSFFSHRQRNTAFGAQYVIGAVVFGVFFLVTLYMQRVLGYSPLEGGLAWLALFGGAFVTLGSAPKLLLRFGARPILTAGLLLAAAGLALFAGLPVDGSYWSDLVPGMVVFGAGLGLAYPPIAVAGIADVDDSETGLAAGLISSGQQIGGAIGLAVLVALASDHARSLVESGSSGASALVSGMHLAFTVGTGLCIAGAAVTIALLGTIKPKSLPQPVAPGTASS
jgi:EmrB/QacA subfamily drug resistance transporter